jgi:hypothetical protein
MFACVFYLCRPKQTEGIFTWQHPSFRSLLLALPLLALPLLALLALAQLRWLSS